MKLRHLKHYHLNCLIHKARSITLFFEEDTNTSVTSALARWRDFVTQDIHRATNIPATLTYPTGVMENGEPLLKSQEGHIINMTIHYGDKDETQTPQTLPSQ